MSDGAFSRQKDPRPLSAAQSVADLKWVVTSTSLIDHAAAIEAHVLNPDQIDGEHLVDFLEARPGYRVGRYFEALVCYWLQHVLQVDLIGHGVQIKDGKRTIGEVDFLFRDDEGRVNHWEVAVKFFLHYPGQQQTSVSQRSHFLGPNASDSFERKTRKVFESQLPISRVHFPEVTIRKALVRGTIFYNQEITRPDSLPEMLASNHNRGQWLRHSQLAKLEAYGSSTGLIAYKPFWLSPRLDSELRSMDDLRSDLLAHFGQSSEYSDYPVMLFVLSELGTAEYNRVFVVPNRWPER